MSNIVQNITKITNIVNCDQEYYAAQSSVTDPYYSTTIYLVEVDATHIDFYYGARKLSDILVVDEYPGSVTYPNDKIYLVPDRDSSNVIYGYKVYFKHDNYVILIDMTGQYVNVVNVGTPENSLWELQFNFGIPGSGYESRQIVCVESDGTLPEVIYNQLYDPLKGWIQANYVTPVWGSF